MTKQTALTDGELLDLFWSRDEQAITETDRKYGAYLFKIGSAFLTRSDDIEDAKSDTILAAWNRIPPERPRLLLAFLAEIMRNISRDRLRFETRQKRKPSVLLSDEELMSLASDKSVEAEYDERRVGELISEYARSLPDRRKYLFVGRFYLCRSPDELAEKLGVSRSTVYRELEEIKKDLKKFLIEKEVFI